MGKCHLTWDNFVVHDVNNPFMCTQRMSFLFN